MTWTAPQIERNIEDAPGDALHQLGLLVRLRLEVEAPQRAGLPVARHTALRQHGIQTIRGKCLRAEDAPEFSALVAMPVDKYLEHAIDRGRQELHRPNHCAAADARAL